MLTSMYVRRPARPSSRPEELQHWCHSIVEIRDGAHSPIRDWMQPAATAAEELSMDSQFADVFLGHPEGELYRPGVLSNAFDGFTRKLFEEAGLHEGMDVLEIGSVNGDVALLAAQFVGPSGSVLGIEPSPEAVHVATARAAEKGVHNVRFVEAAIEGEIPFDQKFDALVGRVV